MSGGKASSGRIKAAERRGEAWVLRKQGHSMRDIADRLGSTKSTIDRDLKRVLDDLNSRTLDAAVEARELDLARLDDLLLAWFPTATRSGEGQAAEDADEADVPPDFMERLEAAWREAAMSKQAAEILLKVLEQRAKLLGLYRQEVALTTPAPLQVAADLSGLDEESLDAIIRNLAAAVGAGGD